MANRLIKDPTAVSYFFFSGALPLLLATLARALVSHARIQACLKRKIRVCSRSNVRFDAWINGFLTPLMCQPRHALWSAHFSRKTNQNKLFNSVTYSVLQNTGLLLSCVFTSTFSSHTQKTLLASSIWCLILICCSTVTLQAASNQIGQIGQF